MESKMKPSADFEIKAINTIRFLSADAVQRANSGHPGLPMGCAAMAYCIWTRHLKFNPWNPHWINRDRFILSGGHGSMLLYSLLYLTGYDLSLEEIKNFRQWNSLTPGHPEYGVTPGVEVTTGPLGQGFANGVGMAIAQKHMANRFNKPDFELFDHYIYAVVTDGDLMEGVASESASLAGHLGLGNLIYLYDDNYISIDGSTDIAFTEDRMKRFDAYHWHTQIVEDGNDLERIDHAIQSAKKDPRPSIIAVKNKIGYGLPTREGTAKAHGEPPGVQELIGAKEKLGWPLEPEFFVPDDVLEYYREVGEKGVGIEEKWGMLLEKYLQKYPVLGFELKRRISGELPENWDVDLPEYNINPKGVATRITSGLVLNQIAKRLPELMGGSADLTPSNKTWIDDEAAFQANSPQGRNIHFGVREHGMGAVVNGLNVYGGIIAFGATFLTFSDYMRPAIRVSALSGYPSIWVFTHDSIGLGEDGPTHQPVEHLAALRAIPNLAVIRPCDANEVTVAWTETIRRRHAPTVLAFSRQNLPILDRTIYAPAKGLARGAYILKDSGDTLPELILMASGSEVSLIIESGVILANEGYKVRLVSFPCWELFDAQEKEYRELVLPDQVKNRIAVEAGVSQGWERWLGTSGCFIGMDQYGKSAPFEVIYEEFGLTVDRIVNTAKGML
jgi:transketolase